ncbi:LOW QUALITY PROTEIN: misexpression suppressor of ras 4 [Aphomia sociella]
MEDGNVLNTKDDKIGTALLGNLYSERHAKLTSNGHDPVGETSNLAEEVYEQCRPGIDTAKEDKCRKRINPLRIHLGKRPFVDNSHQYYSSIKKKKPLVIKPSDTKSTTNSIPRAPKLIPKRVDRSQFHHVTSQMGCSTVDSEQDKPTPRLVPKSQLLQFKKGKIEKGAQLKEYAQSLGLQPMVKFKCRKCCSMSFKTLAMLKDHQLICRAQAKEPTLSPEATPTAEITPGGPSRVTRKVYLCSACGTYYENWNLFLHMREVHNRHICLFCLGMFSKAEKLSLHLTNKHNVQEFNYDNKKEFMDVYNGTLYLMCCVCDEICSEQDDFFNHDCNNVKPKPVPVLVSKNSVKTNSVKSVKNCNELLTNGPTSVIKPVCDKKINVSEIKPETITSHSQKVSLELADCEPTNSDTSISSETSATTSKDTSNTIDSGMELDNSVSKAEASPTHENDFSLNIKNSHPNGDDTLDQSDYSNSPSPDHIRQCSNIDFSSKSEEPVCTPVEKECGIKLKLSLNKANSPVIINSTVDPTVGQQTVHKPPSRVRRPPKRYEKETPLDTSIPSKPPSIKMTICDKADSPFVKTTIIENNKETTLKTLLNNNLESVSKSPEHRQENAIKSTIYDNKMEDVNTLNRVPKLTVRVPKELLDKDSSSDYSSDSDVSDKLTVDENSTIVETDKNIEETPLIEQSANPEPLEQTSQLNEKIKEEYTITPKQEDDRPETPIDVEYKIEPKTEPMEHDMVVEPKVEEPEIPVTELSLDKPLDKYPLKDLLKVFLASTGFNCIYCNHVRKIAVNCEQLCLHMVAQHRFSATVDSITAEELLPETITAKLKTGATDLNSVFINLNSYDSAEMYDEVQYEHLFECFQCYFKTAIHKDLCFHNRKMHQKTILLCVMCKSNFYSYSELLCHLCPGTYDSEYEVKFRCCLCNVDTIPSSFRLMVHLRKIHHTCDVCLEFCHNQARLSNHVWKHKLHHLCYRCGIAYRNKPDITNHLFWKHGTESVLCKKCLQKKWPHVYHFCSPPAIFTCDECSLQFTKAVYLKVHKRFHSNEYPHVCNEEGCTEKFVSKKLLAKHVDDHRKKMIIEDLNEGHLPSKDTPLVTSKEPIPVIDLVNDNPKQEAGTSVCNTESGTEQLSKKAKKKKMKEKDALLLDVNLPALDLSESDSSDESDSGMPLPNKDGTDPKPGIEKSETDANQDDDTKSVLQMSQLEDIPAEVEEEKSNEQQVLDIWDNFKKYQAKVETKEKTPPLVPIRKHVCESDHDYCLIPSDLNGDDESFGMEKRKTKSPKKRHGDLSSSSSSSSDSDSSCSCGSNCSCSSSSGSSSSSSSGSDSSDESGTEKKKKKQLKKTLPNRRISNGSNVDVMGMSETPVLIPEKTEPPIPETDLETNESETDEEFYDKNPQRTNKLHTEKRNQTMLLATVAPSDGGSVSGEASRPATPVKEEKETKLEIDVKDKEEIETKEKPTSSKKKSKKKKKSKSSKKHAPIKINIPKEVIAKSDVETTPLLPNKITISLQSNTVQIPEVTPPPSISASTPASSTENKRASKRRRVPNKFYGYSSDEESPSGIQALKPHQPPKLEWRKEDLPSPVTHKAKKELPSTVTPQRMYNYIEPIRLTTPIPDPEPPKILMNTESMESSDSDSSDEGNLEIYQPNSYQTPAPIPPPTYLNSGTSSLPYPFQRPVVRQAREGESVYCYCRCPYDEVSEMIACDAEGCSIEWFHFECVGIMVPPKGRWYCPECRKNQSFSGYR